MLLAKLLADVKSSEPICFGPFCPAIKDLPSGSGGNGGITQLLGSTFGSIVNLFVIFTGLAMLLYLLWGAFDWVTSGGEKEKLEKARDKITHASVGIVIVIIALMFFGFLAGDILGIIIRNDDNSWTLKIPLLTQ